MSEPSKESLRWHDTKEHFGDERLLLGPYFTFQFLNTPRRVLHMLSYHKFGAKMIGPDKRILEIGCSEGLGTRVLGEFAAQCVGIDIDAAAIAVANESLASERFRFVHADILAGRIGTFDAAACFDVIEHIFPENEEAFIAAAAANLVPSGMFIAGTPNITSDQYAAEHTKAGHVNLYSAERLRASLGRHFENVLLFSANDEMVHTGFAPMAHYLIGIGLAPRKR